jgi:hypothetical protein
VIQPAPIAPLAPLPPLLSERLRELYTRLDRALAREDVSCRGCGECCHLERFGHQAWLTNLELAYLLECHPRTFSTSTSSAGVCPYLDGERCAAREGRTVSCRVFHCDGADDDTLAALYEKTLTAIRALAAQFDVVLEYGELLSSLQVQRGQTDQTNG